MGEKRERKKNFPKIREWEVNAVSDKELGQRAIFLYFGSLQGGIKCGNQGTGFLDSEGSHR